MIRPNIVVIWWGYDTQNISRIASINTYIYIYTHPWYHHVHYIMPHGAMVLQYSTMPYMTEILWGYNGLCVCTYSIWVEKSSINIFRGINIHSQAISGYLGYQGFIHALLIFHYIPLFICLSIYSFIYLCTRCSSPWNHRKRCLFFFPSKAYGKWLPERNREGYGSRIQGLETLSFFFNRLWRENYWLETLRFFFFTGKIPWSIRSMQPGHQADPKWSNWSNRTSAAMAFPHGISSTGISSKPSIPEKKTCRRPTSWPVTFTASPMDRCKTPARFLDLVDLTRCPLKL